MKKKSEEGKPRREKKFLDLPEYPGGKEALQAFVRQHLIYPPEALEKKVEGSVMVQYWVDGQGKVTEAVATHGVGAGCDEEAVRVVKLLKYGKVKNRGMRVKASMKTRIDFRLPAQPSVQFSYKEKDKKKEGDEQASKPSVTYTYTIPLS